MSRVNEPYTTPHGLDFVDHTLQMIRMAVDNDEMPRRAIEMAQELVGPEGINTNTHGHREIARLSMLAANFEAIEKAAKKEKETYRKTLETYIEVTKKHEDGDAEPYDPEGPPTRQLELD